MKTSSVEPFAGLVLFGPGGGPDSGIRRQLWDELGGVGFASPPCPA